ncbi:UDP-arabinose 4-epimerase [Trifolium repens]|nr:UDP-arabinose 4-epimerase [Trifolium repens]
MSKIAPHNPIKPTYSFAKKWFGPGMKYYKTPQHDIIGYRSRIDHMNADDVLYPHIRAGPTLKQAKLGL